MKKEKNKINISPLSTINYPLNKGWEMKKLGDVADVEYGFTDKSTEKGHYRYVRITDIDKNGELISTEKKYINFSKEAESFIIQKNDLLMARTGATFAKVLLFNDEEPSVFASYLIRINFKIEFENKLYWYFSKSKSYWEQANNLQTGAAQPHFNGAALKQIEFSFPKSLAEQQRIVAYLDQTFAKLNQAKANTLQNQQNAKELFETELNEIFSNENWEKKTLNEISENLDSKRIPITKGVRSQGKIPYYGASGIVDYVAEYIFDEDLLCVSEDGANLLARTYPIAFSISGKTWVNNHAHILRFKNIESQYFVEYYLNSIKLDDFVTGMAQPKLNQAMLNKIPIPFPNLQTQQEIVAKLDALKTQTQQLEGLYQTKLHNIEELYSGILKRAFENNG
jgi:type I restriction enzyme, S subunit